MLRHSRLVRPRALLAALLAGATALATPLLARAQDPQQAQPSGQIQTNARALLRRLQHEQLLEPARAALREARERAELERRAARGDRRAKRGLQVRKVIDDEGSGTLGMEPSAWTGVPNAPLAAAGSNAIPVNVRCNNPALQSDAANAGQAEQSIAAIGNQVLVAWNDGQGFNTGGDVQGFAWSNDGGATFTDGGDVIHPPGFPAWRWASDPVVTVNEKTGDFFYLGLAAPTALTNAIAIAHGRFTAGVFSFDSAFVVRNESNSAFFLDKEWFAADSGTGNVYVTNTTFVAPSGNHVDFYRSTDRGRTWSAPMQISSVPDIGFIQGSRPAVGPNGEVYTTWYAIEPSVSIDTDHFRFRASTDRGVTFQPEMDANDIISNFGTGAPGFNRGRGLTFPSLAVDRTTGPFRGRVYMAWNESFDWLNDPLTIFATGVVDADTPTANNVNSTPSLAQPFTIGQTIRGTLATTTNGGVVTRDLDYYSTTLNAGDRIIAFVDSATTGRAFSLRLFAPTPDAGQLLCYSGKLDSTSGSSQLVWTFMAPASGTYYLRLGSNSFRTLQYRLLTAFAAKGGERGRDQRDVFVSSWNPGDLNWSFPTRVNDNATGLDDYLPEVSVGADGLVYTMWFDSRDDLYGSRTHVYMSRSADGGATWAANQRSTDAQSNFTTCPVNIIPNMGDYNAMTGTATAMLPSWADGRGTSVDVFATSVSTASAIGGCRTDTTVDPAAVIPLIGTITNSNPLFAGNYSVNVTSTRNWPMPAPTPVAVAAASFGGFTGSVTVPDTASAGTDTICVVLVTPGGVRAAQCCFRVTVNGGQLAVGGGPSVLRLEPPFPNPANGGSRISYALPAAGRVRLAIYGVAGERVRTLVDGTRPAGVATAVWDGRDDAGNAVRPGAYFFRLEFAGRTLTSRIALMR